MKTKDKFVCFVCNQIAKSAKQLEIHIKHEHKGVDVYLCSCDRSFLKKETFEDHVNCKHLRIESFRCEKGCDEEFNTRSTRRAHHLKMHEGFQYVCKRGGCNKRYKRKDTYTHHLSSSHEFEFKVNSEDS